MYNLGIHLFSFGIAIASHFSEKIKKMWQGEHEAFDVLKSKVDPSAQYIWVHAASLGEFEQGRPLIEHIKKEHPEQKVLLTFFSPSGYEVRKNYQEADIICYLPIDTASNARRFLSLIRVKMAFFIKYEFWYNYMHILKQQGVPVYSISCIFRENQIFFRWYGKPYSKVLNCITHFYAQNEESRQLLAGLGLTNVTVTGDTRFDRVLQIRDAAKHLAIVEKFIAGNPSKVFVAGSSWQPDEEIFIKYFNEHRDWKLIIAPHVISEEHLKQIEKQLEGRKVVRYTEAENASGLDKCDALIINCFGLLSSIYHYAQVTYVGGGFGVGIHNVLEAAVWNVPVIIGPNNKKFQEAQELMAAGGCFEITSYADFEQIMNRFETDALYLSDAGKKAGEYVKNRAGATNDVFTQIESNTD